MDEPSANDWAAKLYVSQIVIEENLRPVLADYANLEQRRFALADRLSLLSPAAALDQYLTDVAGTGRLRQAAFTEQAINFLRNWRETYAPWIFARRSLTAEEIPELPEFHFAEPPIPPRAATTLGVLALYAAIAAALAAGGMRQTLRSSKGVT